MAPVHPATTHRIYVTQTLSSGDSFSLRASPHEPWYPASTLRTVLLLPLLLPAGVLWLAGMSVRPVRDILLSLVIPRMMKAVDKEFQKERETLLRSVSGRVLDVGSGGGAYLKYCGKADHVVAVEPNTALHAKIQEAGQHLPQLTIVRDLSEVPQASAFDWAILGNVLCEVPHVPTALSQIDSLLKLGGRIYFSEHIGSPKGTWQRSLQDWINPLWRYAGGGCNCNRDSLQELRNLGYDIVSWKYDHIRVCMGPFVLGLALKKE